MNTIINNTTINVGTLSVAELFELAKQAKAMAKEEMYLEIPVGFDNAKSAKEILGENYRHISNFSWKYDEKMSRMVNKRVQSVVTDGGIKIYRRLVKIQKVYANIENPLDTMTVTREHSVYWRV